MAQFAVLRCHVGESLGHGLAADFNRRALASVWPQRSGDVDLHDGYGSIVLNDARARALMQIGAFSGERPQRLKPEFLLALMARLKPCPFKASQEHIMKP